MHSSTYNAASDVHSPSFHFSAQSILNRIVACLRYLVDYGRNFIIRSVTVASVPLALCVVSRLVILDELTENLLPLKETPAEEHSRMYFILAH